MWLYTIKILTSYNLNEIGVYQENKSYYHEVEEDIYIFVAEGIKNLPIFFSFPLKIYSTLLWLFFLRKGNAVKLYKIKIPFFGILNKLIKSLVLLRLFDELSIEEINNNKLKLIQ